MQLLFPNESQMLQPTSDQPLPPTSDQPLPPTSDQPLPPTSDQPLRPTSDQPLPPTSDQFLPPTSNQRLPSTSVLSDITVDDSLLHQYCVVKYDSVPYPGLITNVESNGDGLEVSVLHSVGDSRFFWPRMEDVCVYAMDDVLTLIPPPKKITRHYQVDSEIWRNVKDHLNI
ncbi:uncharacterized protein LOC123539206 [Mercenaria mercenaria]|uniref:uncharacterized protein LOC123539206 n=1 Tax=Mercenaria mercenaria TaxID=6596 RepID=UPI00234F051B|nr:uncharacterized protein LOC123539206 [Mercenaria mercenaria]